MDPKTVQPTVWELADRQHGVVAREQLLALGYRSDAIKHRLAIGKLHRVATGVYAVGRPRLTRMGRWMAAVMSCGPGAALSHASAAALWRIRPATTLLEVSVPVARRPRRPGIVVHRCEGLAQDVTRHQGIPVTNPVRTLVDLAPRIDRSELEAAVNEADKLDLVSTEELRGALDAIPRRPGVAILRALLDRRTFRLTDSHLERLFLGIVDDAGLPMPQTGTRLNGFKVDFYWEDSVSSSKQTACATTARPPSRPRTSGVSRCIPPRAGPRCGSPTHRSGSSPTTFG